MFLAQRNAHTRSNGSTSLPDLISTPNTRVMKYSIISCKEENHRSGFFLNIYFLSIYSMVRIWLGNQKHFKILAFALPGNFRKSNLESLKRTISKFDLLGIYKPPSTMNRSMNSCWVWWYPSVPQPLEGVQEDEWF